MFDMVEEEARCDQSESGRRATVRGAGWSLIEEVDAGAGAGAPAVFARSRGAMPMAATDPSSLAKKCFREGSWLTG
jgi:hypothetical protein